MAMTRNNLSKQARAAFLLTVAFAAFAAATAQALPRPAAATFAHGAQFEVAGYDSSRPALANFPVLVRIAANSPSGFQYSQLQSPTDGADLCFIDMNGNGLPFEIDTWNTDGTSLVWVALPAMEQGTRFVMCWGGSTSGKAVCADNPFAGYKGAWHMNATSPADASGSGNDGTASGDVALTNGVVGTGLSYPDKSSYVSCGSSQAESELTANGYTIEGWVNLANTSGNKALFGKSGFISYRMEGTSVKITTPAVSDYNSVNNFITAPNEWHHFALSFKPNTTGGAKHYVDGVLKSEQNTGAINNKTDSIEMWLGRNQWGNDQSFVGLLDEYRLSPSIRSADWIAATYATQSGSAFLTAGEVQDYEATAAPDVGLVAPSAAVGYTNATLTASVGSLGMDDTMTTDAAWVDPVLVVSANMDLSDPLFAIPLPRAVAVPSSIPAAISPLVVNTTYYAKLFATNSFGVAGESGVIPFTTAMPGAPTGTAAFQERGFTTLTATGATTGFGTGGESAAMRLEASTNGFETVAASSLEAVAAIGESAAFTIPGLLPDTTYALRLRITNEWGVAATVALPDASTLDVPFTASGVGYSLSSDFSAISLSFVVNEVFDGAQCSASMVFGETTLGDRSFDGPGTLSWPAQPVPSSPTVATVTVVATVGGQTYEKTWTATVRPGGQSTTIDSIDDHVTAATAVRLHVGDTMNLPPLSGTDFYEVGNHLFASLDGTTATALRPGVVGIHQRRPDDEGGTNFTLRTLALIVLPDPIPGGDVYILDETKYSDSWGSWTDSSGWEKLGSETRDSYPCRPNDIAIVPLCDVPTIQIDPQAEDIALGALYVGGFKDATAYNLSFRCQSTAHSVSFDRTDGEKALLQLCSSTTYLGNNQYRTWVKFQNTIPSVRCRVNTVYSGGFDGTSSSTRHGRIEWNAITEIPEGVTLELVEFDTQGQDMSGTMYVGKLSGGGVFWNHSSAMLRVDSNQNDFTGTWRDSGGHGADGQGQGRSSPIFFRTTTVTNSSVETVGWVHCDGVNPTTSYNRGVGAICTGWPHTYNPKGPHLPWFPARGLQMHGGLVWNRVECSGEWTGDITQDVRYTDRLTVGGGFNFIFSDGNNSYPTVVFEAAAVTHEGTASLRLDSISAMTENGVENQITTLHGIGAFLEGGGKDPEISNAYSMAPWIVSKLSRWNNEDKLCFAAFDTNGRHVAPKVRASGALATWGEEDNAYVSGSGIALEDSLAIRSLTLSNGDKEKKLGAGRMLTVKSGGILFLSGNSAIGVEGGDTANGYLVLGDATHPAYVWARGSSSNPNAIWTPAEALGGFVAAYTGNLVLGGDQTGIGGEIAVNAGSLQLGTSSSGCQLAQHLPIHIFANATLRLPNVESTKFAIVKFDGAAGWFGKVEIPGGVAAKCWKAYWRDFPEAQEWQNLKRGVYTGDEATALANPKIVYDPERFSGEGTIEVLRDDLAMPLVIRLK